MYAFIVWIFLMIGMFGTVILTIRDADDRVSDRHEEYVCFARLRCRDVSYILTTMNCTVTRTHCLYQEKWLGGLVWL